MPSAQNAMCRQNIVAEGIGAGDVVVDEVYGAIAKVEVMPQAMQQLINNPFILCVQLHWTISLSERQGAQEENCPKLGFSGLAAGANICAGGATWARAVARKG